MTPAQCDGQVESALKAAYLLIGNPKLQDEIVDPKGAEAALKRLQLSSAARPSLLQIITKLTLQDDVRARSSSQSEPDGQPEGDENPRTREVRRILLESFDHIRWTFWVSITMSVVLFLVGLVFFGAALIRSVGAEDAGTSTFVLAGVGVADFVLLFYTRPWQDVATNLANSQQMRMIVTSYLAGFEFIRSEKAETRAALQELTERSVQLVATLGRARERVANQVNDLRSGSASQSSDAVATSAGKPAGPED